MGRLRYAVSMSLDGFVAGPGKAASILWACAGSYCTIGCANSRSGEPMRASRAA